MKEQSCDKGQAIDFLTQYYIDNESLENELVSKLILRSLNQNSVERNNST